MAKHQSPITQFNRLVKSVLDRLVALIALLILSPVLLIIGITI